MKCSYCSRELDNSANFCTYCGSMVQKNTETGDSFSFVLPAVPVKTEQAEVQSIDPPETAETVYPREFLSFRTVNYGPRRHRPVPGRR